MVFFTILTAQTVSLHRGLVFLSMRYFVARVTEVKQWAFYYVACHNKAQFSHGYYENVPTLICWKCHPLYKDERYAAVS